MLFTNALAMLTIRGEIRRLEHTRQPSDVRRTTTKMTCHPKRDRIAGGRQRSVRGRLVEDLLR
jgi:hypothetical protein